MKYLQNDRLSALSSRLFNPDLPNNNYHHPNSKSFPSFRQLRGRIEAYTMKRTSTDKKYASQLGVKYVSRLEQQQQHVQQLQQQQQEEEEEYKEEGPLLPALPTTNKRRSQSVGVVPNDHFESQRNNKKARSRSNSLDENVLAYHTSIGDFAAQETRRLMTDLVLTLNMSFPDYDFEEVSPNDFERTEWKQVVQHVQSLLLADEVAAGTGMTTSISSSKVMPSVKESDMVPEHEPTETTLALLPTTETMTAITATALDLAETASSVDHSFDDSTGNNNNNHSNHTLLTELWSAVDSVVHLNDCEIYRWKNPPEDLLTNDVDDDADDDDDQGEIGYRGDEDHVMNLWSFYYLFVNKTIKRLVFFCCGETLLNRRQLGSTNLESGLEDDDVAAGNGALPFVGKHEHGDTMLNVDLVSEGEDEGEEDEEDLVTLSQHYKMILSSGDASSSEVDFDLDPAVTAGGIPVSTI